MRRLIGSDTGGEVSRVGGQEKPVQLEPILAHGDHDCMLAGGQVQVNAIRDPAMVLGDAAGTGPIPGVFAIAPLHCRPGEWPGVVDTDMSTVVFRSRAIGAEAGVIASRGDDVHLVVHARRTLTGLEEIDPRLERIVVSHPAVRQDFHVLAVARASGVGTVRIRRGSRRGRGEDVPIPVSGVSLGMEVFCLDHQQAIELLKDRLRRRRPDSDDGKADQGHA